MKGILFSHSIINSRAGNETVQHTFRLREAPGSTDAPALVLWAMGCRSDLAHSNGKNVVTACGLPTSRTNLISSAQLFVNYFKQRCHSMAGFGVSQQRVSGSQFGGV